MSEARQVDWNVAQGLALFPWLGQDRHRTRALTAQESKTDPAAKPLNGFGGASVFEIVASHHGNAWRAVYTVRFQDAIYVLHLFQKKSTKGIATPTREIELIKRRLVEAERDYRERQN
jgi:phage-related protein